jgi:PAS domain S-box-containing protein
MTQKVLLKRRRHWYFAVISVVAVETFMALVGHRFDLIRLYPIAGALINAPLIFALLSILVIWPVERELTEQSNRIVKTVNEQLEVESRHVREIEERETRYKAVVEDLTEMVVRRKASGEITFANPAFLGAFGLTEDGVVGKTFPVMPDPQDRPCVDHKLKELGAATPLVKVWHRVETSQGTRWQSWTHHAILRPDGQVSEIQSVGSDITAMHATQDQIAQSRAELRDLAHRLFALQEEERRAVAKEIHDGLCQSLNALSFQVAFMRENLDLDREQLKADMNAISQLLRGVISEARELSRRLRPGILDDLGLIEAVRADASQFAARTGITCDVIAPEEGPPLGLAVRGAAYRIIEEVLRNVERHSGATAVRLELAFDGARLVIDILDNGRGIPPERMDDPRSLGLLGMRERANAIQGGVSILPGENCGSRIHVEMPLFTELES